MYQAAIRLENSWSTAQLHRYAHYVVCRSKYLSRFNPEGSGISRQLGAAGWDLFRFECPETLGSPVLQITLKCCSA